MMSQPLELTFLGSGNAFAPGRYWSSFLVNNRILFDPSPIALPHLKMLGKAVNDIEAIFISHFHADHWFGLPFLLLEFAEGSNRATPLTIVGPPGVEERVRTVTEAGFASAIRKAEYGIRWLEVGDRQEQEAGRVPFTAYQVEHAADLQCFGFRAQIDGRTLAYTGDTLPCDALAPMAEGAEVLVSECSCWGTACGPHLSPEDVRALKRQIDPSTRFVLTHLGEGAGPFGDEYVIARDLMSISL